MAEIVLPAQAQKTGLRERSKRWITSSTLTRVAKYTLLRMLALFMSVVVGVYLTILIANMGGYVDQIRRGAIREQIAMSIVSNTEVQQLGAEARLHYIESQIAVQEKRLGLERPFFLRSLTYLSDALTLNLGRSENMISDSGSKQVRLILLERLPATLLLFATGQLVLFFMAIFIALALSRHYGSWLDRTIIALAPTSAAPSWFYGLFLILFFAALGGVLPFGGMVSAPPPQDIIAYALSVLKHLILPVSAIVISAVFLTIYSWRTFFLIYSSEDYVEMAQAKGLPERMIERRYILRPTLPIIVTSFALTLISVWTGAIVLETIFNWPGLGRLLYQAIGLYDTPVIVGSVVIYAYLLAMTVFLLDIFYAWLDPRVKVGDQGAQRAARS